MAGMDGDRLVRRRADLEGFCVMPKLEILMCRQDDVLLIPTKATAASEPIAPRAGRHVLLASPSYTAELIEDGR